MEALVAYYRKYESETPDFRAVVAARRRGRRAPGVPRPLHDVERRSEVPMAKVLDGAAGQHAADLHARRDRHALLHRAAALRRGRVVPGRARQRHSASSAPYAPFVENATRPAAASYQRRRSRPRDAALHADQGAPLRRRHRSAAGRLRGRRVVVRDDRRGAGERSRNSSRARARAGRSWWQRGGFDHVERHDDRVQLFATRLSEGAHEFSYIVAGDDRRHVPDGAGAGGGDVSRRKYSAAPTPRRSRSSR